jgi:hypothetical protein
MNHNLLRTVVLKHIFEGKIEGMRIRIRRCTQLLEKVLEFERGSTSFLSLEISFWKRL